jgi:hypothetical protein
VFAKPRSASRLRFSRRQWRRMVDELARRGRGERESGAFLLVDAPGGTRVREIVYFDDLDPTCLTGGISLDGSAYPPLWEICRRRRLRVGGDVHTHPEDWVGQSHTDKDNPMIAVAGHLALIVPHLATRGARPYELGVHEYLGAEGWRANHDHEAATLVYVGWWP